MIKNKNKIEKLIAELCPNGVDFKMLGELEDDGIIKLGRGEVISKNDISNMPGNYPVYSSSASGEGEFGRYGKFMFTDERITWSIDGGGKFFYRSAHKYSVTNVSGWLKVNDKNLLNIRYLYFLLSHSWLTKIFDYTKKAHPSVIRNEYNIPIPPLKIQEEIVKILDNFKKLEAELEAELEARNSQYKYYLEKLLDVKNVDQKTLKEITVATINIKWKETDRTYKYIDLTSVSRVDHSINGVIDINSNNAPSRAQKIVQKNDVIFATTRPTQQRYTLINDYYDGQIASTGYCILRADERKVLPKWIYFNMATSWFKDYVEKYQEGSAYPSISDSKTKDFTIPVPSLSEQERIVSILDKFDVLVNDISIGLPAELKARRQQYEYYRNKLLTFKEYAK